MRLRPAKGIDNARATGVLAGWPVIGLRVTLTDGRYHDVDSSPHAFEVAARAACREGMTKAAPCLLEPVMTVEVTTPAGLLRDIARDLRQRRGEVVAIGGGGDARAITAMVPLAGMLGYAHTIGSQSKARVRLVMRFSHYAQTSLPPPDDPSFRPAAATRA